MARSNDIAWAAGLFEGEGSIVIYQIPNRKNSYRTSLSLQMSDEDVIKRFYSVFEIGNLLGPYKGQREGNKEKYLWQTQNYSDCLNVLGQLYPYLGIRRKEKADMFIDIAINRWM